MSRLTGGAETRRVTLLSVASRKRAAAERQRRAADRLDAEADAAQAEADDLARALAGLDALAAGGGAA